EYLSKRPELARALTRADLQGPIPQEDRIAAMARRSYYPDRAGDVFLVLKPFYVPSLEFTGATGTTHGAPYDYDTHVPLLVIGPGVVGGTKFELVAPQAMAATFLRCVA